MRKNTQSIYIKEQCAAFLISNKIDFKPKVIRRDREGHYIQIRGKKITKRTLYFLIAVHKTKAQRNLKKKHHHSLIHILTFTH